MLPSAGLVSPAGVGTTYPPPGGQVPLMKSALRRGDAELGKRMASGG